MEISVNTIITTIPGWDVVSNASAGVLGRDVETRTEFETRRYNSVAMNAHGSVSAIQGAIADIDGVLDCKVLENSTDTAMTILGVSVDPHSICVCVYGGDGTDIAEAIYRKKDAGCGTTGSTTVSYTDPDFNNAVYTYKILRPIVVDVKMTVTVMLLGQEESKSFEGIYEVIEKEDGSLAITFDFGEKAEEADMSGEIPLEIGEDYIKIAGVKYTEKK